MLPKIENYYLREQSYIKHLFLVKYLENAAYKLFLGRSPVFNYVDAFSGPWRNSDVEAMSDTSFGLAIASLEKVRSILVNMGFSGLKVRFRFCEKNPEAFAKLQAFAAGKSDFDIKVFPGAFENNLDAIKASCVDVRESFTFTFVDPTGWDVDSGPIFSFLKDLRGEVLFNFMAEHVNRHAGWDGVAQSVGRFLADSNWRPAFEAIIGGSNEERILQLLKANMRRAGAATYLPDIVIKKPRENRIKMRLILGTHSGHGVDVFRKVQQDVESDALRTRNAIKTAESGQFPLFSDEQIVDFEAQRAGVGCPANLEAARQALLQAVSTRPGTAYGKLAFEIMEQVPVTRTHVNKIAMAERKSARLRFDLPPNKRTPQLETKLSPGA
ncbi:three-Cys-motif partner protein TcmP [Bosea sp. NPDC055332]